MLRMMIAAAALFATAAMAGDTPSAKGAKVGFETLKNGDVVHSPFTVKFAISGMALAPAGSDTPNSGHHHLLIDVPAPTAADLAAPLPLDDQHRHYGKAQTEAEISLPKGKHTLQLVLGDANHVPHNPPVMSERITVDVE